MSYRFVPKSVTLNDLERRRLTDFMAILSKRKLCVVIIKK